MNNGNRTKKAKRDRADIIGQILKNCKEGACKNRIITRANLNSKNAGYYLNLLTSQGLLERAGNSYFTSEKGNGLLDSLDDTAAFFIR